MHFDQIPSLVISLAGTAVGAFICAVVADNILGVLLALRQGKFDWNKLPSFLASQFGTKQALALGGLVVTASLAGGDIKSALLAALATGGGALTLAVLADVMAKIKALVAPTAALPVK